MNGQRNESLIENISMNEAEVSSLVEKYDQESRYRRLSGWQGKFATFWLAAMSLFHLYTAGITAMPITIQRDTSYIRNRRRLCALSGDAQGRQASRSVVRLAARCRRGQCRRLHRGLLQRDTRRGAEPLGYEIFLGVAAILLVIEAGRRVVGLVLPCLSVLFLLYCYFGYYARGCSRFADIL